MTTPTNFYLSSLQPKPLFLLFNQKERAELKSLTVDKTHGLGCYVFTSNEVRCFLWSESKEKEIMASIGNHLRYQPELLELHKKNFPLERNVRDYTQLLAWKQERDAANAYEALELDCSGCINLTELPRDLVS